MVAGVIYGMFAFFLICGALLGLKRGLVKSVIRIITVLLCCVLVVFVCGPITTAILTADLSSVGVMIGDVPLTSIQDTIINYISQISIVGELLKTSPTLMALVNALPSVIVNLFLFVLLFFILKSIAYVLDAIINRVVIKKDSDAPIRRWWGALVGGVQGLIVFLFVLIPIAGTMNLITETVEIMDDENAGNMQLVAVADEEQGVISATGVIDEYNDVFLVKMFNAVGYKAITNAVFDKVTTMEVVDEKTTLRKELHVVAKVYNNYETLKDVDIAYFSAENEENAKELIENAFSSPVFSGVTTELVTGVANAWTGMDVSQFMGLNKPIFDEKLLGTFDSLLLNLRTDTKEDLEKDLKVLVSVMKVSADYGLTANLNSGNPDVLVNTIGADGCMESIVGVLSTGKTTKAIIPSIIEYGFSYGYEAVGINEELEINKNVNQINWETEKVVLGDVFEGMAGTYASIKQDGEVLEKINFSAFAKTLDSIRKSQLLSGVNQDITVALLSSDLLNGINTEEFIANVRNSERYREIEFVSMFEALESSINIAGDMKDVLENPTTSSGLSNSDVEQLLGGLTTDGPAKDIIVEFSSAENLKESGVEGSLANAVGGVISSIADYNGETPVPTGDDVDNATMAIESLIAVSKSANDKKLETKNYIFGNEKVPAKSAMRGFIESMSSSEFVFNATVMNGEELGFTKGGVSNLSADEQVWMIEVLNELQFENGELYTPERCGQIKTMFGL